jgi:hypothetical protein
MRILLSSILLTLFVAFAAADTRAQTRVFKWSDESCEFEARYNTKLHSERALRDTLKLIQPGSFYLQTEATAWTYDAIPKLSIAALDREYREKTAQLKALKLVSDPYFEGLRQRKLAEMEKVYRLSSVTIRAYADRSALGGYNAGSCSSLYARPIASGGDTLINAWRRVNEDSRKKNADPERLRRIFDEQNASPDRERYALVEVMMFGWWNCANARIAASENSDADNRAFRKLFTRVKTVRCDEP